MRKAGDVCFSEVYREGGGELFWLLAAVLISLFHCIHESASKFSFGLDKHFANNCQHY
jgi:hypothetical protein